MSYWADSLLVGVLFPVIAGFLGSWLWAKYDGSDFAAKCSVTSTQERIKRLERRLQEFQRVFADTKLFLARIVLDGVRVILEFSLAMLMMVSFRLDGTEFLIMSLPNSGIKLRIAEILPSALDLIGATVFLFLVFRDLRAMSVKCVTPVVYQRDLSERMARLRSRLGGRPER
jgi:hypothetical protein